MLNEISKFVLFEHLKKKIVTSLTSISVFLKLNTSKVNKRQCQSRLKDHYVSGVNKFFNSGKIYLKKICFREKAQYIGPFGLFMLIYVYSGTSNNGHLCTTATS